jgi:hypothetical protein
MFEILTYKPFITFTDFKKLISGWDNKNATNPIELWSTLKMANWIKDLSLENGQLTLDFSKKIFENK